MSCEEDDGEMVVTRRDDFKVNEIGGSVSEKKKWGILR